mmetsp:Transcript_36437/g.96935  ORF Transcript_36437/g.96935 Transcript_36437/m.96935 type:complete len:764 (-) Transcript_36437:19-2310(-)
MSDHLVEPLSHTIRRSNSEIVEASSCVSRCCRIFRRPATVTEPDYRNRSISLTPAVSTALRGPLLQELPVDRSGQLEPETRHVEKQDDSYESAPKFVEGNPLPSSEPILLAKGDLVQVWSKSKSRWFDDGVVTVVASKEGVHEGYRVKAGSVMVRFSDGILHRWCTQEQVKEILRRPPFMWVPIRKGDALPHRVVSAGSTKTDAENYVARNQQGEAGKLTIADGHGPRRAWGIWTHTDGRTEDGDVLVLAPGFTSQWVKFSRAAVLPDGAVFVGSAEKSGNTYVGRNKQGEAGKVTLENHVSPKKTETDSTSPTVPDVLKVEAIHCHHGGRSYHGEILVIRETSIELEVDVISATDLTEAELRFHNTVKALVNAPDMQPFVKITVQGVSWTSGWRVGTSAEDSVTGRASFLRRDLPKSTSFSCEFGERTHFAVGSDAEELEFDAEVYDRYTDTLDSFSVRSEPLVGDATLKVDLRREDEELHTLELKRKSKPRGKLNLRVRVTRHSQTRSLAAREVTYCPSTFTVTGTQVALPDVYEKLSPRVAAEGRHRPTVSTVCLDALAGKSGGIVLIILDSEKYPAFEPMDGGLSTELSRCVVGNIVEEQEKFVDLLAMSSTSYTVQSWELSELQALSQMAPPDMTNQVSGLTSRLDGQPKGGAWILSSRGTILATGAKLTIGSEGVYRYIRPTGSDAYPGFSAATFAAYWMGREHVNGTVFARSASGYLSVLFPPERPGAPPLAFHMNGPSQDSFRKASNSYASEGSH